MMKLIFDINGSLANLKLSKKVSIIPESILLQFDIIFLKVSADFTSLSSLSCGTLLAKSFTLLTISYIALS